MNKETLQNNNTRLNTNNNSLVNILERMNELPTVVEMPEKGFMVTEWDDEGYAIELNILNPLLPESVLDNEYNGSSMIKKRLKRVILSDSIIEIPKKAFYKSATIEEINLDNIQMLRSQCFNGCAGLTQLSLYNLKGSSSFYAIDSEFNGCTNLKAVWIGDQLKTPSKYIFYGCTSLKKIFINRPRAEVEQLTYYSVLFSNNTITADIIICNDDEGFITKEEFDAIDWSTYTG